MSSEPLYTIREIARSLDLPESTVRYYRDAFESYLPVVGRGRRRRYPAEAAEILRTIAEGYARGLDRQRIAAVLGDPREEVAHSNLPIVGYDESPAANGDILTALVDAERDNREAMLQMAHEILRLGQVIERQQETLERISESVLEVRPALPPGDGADGEETQSESPPVEGDMEELRRRLAEEQALVERLRRSRLDLERRAAEAEERLADVSERADNRGSTLRRLLGKSRS